MRFFHQYGKLKFIFGFRVLILFFIVSLFSCAGTVRQYNVEPNEDAVAAENYVRNGDYHQALKEYKHAILAYESEKNEEGILFCLERMGWLQREIGQYGDALESFRKAYPIGVRLNGDAAEIDADLGDIYLFSGASKKAEEHYMKALTTLKDFVFKTSYSRPPSSAQISTMVRKVKAIAHARVNLGTMYAFSGQYEEALKHLKIADELINRVRIVNKHPLYGMFFKMPLDYYTGVGYGQTMTGLTYGEMGQPDKARQYFDAGKVAFETVQDRYGLLVNQALRYKIESQSPDFRVEEANFEEYDQFLEEIESFGALDVLWRVSYVIGMALKKHQAYDDARNYLARAIDALELTRSRLREDTIKKMFASSVQDVYSEIITLLFDMGRYEEGFEYLERAKARAFLDMLAGRSVKAKKAVDPLLIKKEKELQEEIESLTRKLRTLRGPQRKTVYKNYKKLVRERKNVLEVIKGQSLEYASTTTIATISAKEIESRLDEKTALVSYFLDRQRILLWVMKKGRISASSVSIGAEELGRLIAEYREAIASRQETLRANLGEKLADILIEPISAELERAEKLYIIPSNALHYLPFSSLPLDRERFLVQRYSISILPNASSIFYLDKQITDDRDSIFALGNPKRDQGEVDLEFAEAEVKSISRGFSRKTVLTGKDASEGVIKTKDLTDTGVVHIAAHGTYNSDYPLKSALLLTRDKDNDGNLETFEIYSLSMNPRLVILSACQSGIGRVEGGDEVQSLNRAFLYAGAGGVIASLWNVSDESTFKLMEYLYENMQTKPVAVALQEAQLRLMEDFKSPFYWAPFYMTGGVAR
ncbi:CHAT domain-containing protein [Thermodesulfobacteriota bacterium]